MGQSGGWSVQLNSMDEEWRRAGSPEENQSPGSQRRCVLAFAGIILCHNPPLSGLQHVGLGWLDSGLLHMSSHSGTQAEGTGWIWGR